MRSVIGWHKWDHVSDVIICPLIVYRQQPMKMYIAVLLLFIISTANSCFLSQYLWHMFICLRFSTFSYFDLKRLQRSEEIKDNLGTKFPNAISLRLKRKNKTPLQPPAKLCHVPPNLLTPVYVMGPRIFPMMHRVKVVQWFHHVAREVSVLSWVVKWLFFRVVLCQM